MMIAAATIGSLGTVLASSIVIDRIQGYIGVVPNYTTAMATVNVIDGVRYGLDLIIYIFVIGLATGLGLLIGVAIGNVDNIAFSLIGGLIALASFLAFYAGMMGILYKVIADGVTVGMEAANRSSETRTPHSKLRFATTESIANGSRRNVF